MRLVVVVALVVVGLGFPFLWIWWVNRKVHSEYQERWDNLNAKVGGVLPPYDEALKKSPSTPPSLSLPKALSDRTRAEGRASDSRMGRESSGEER